MCRIFKYIKKGLAKVPFYLSTGAHRRSREKKRACESALVLLFPPLPGGNSASPPHPLNPSTPLLHPANTNTPFIPLENKCLLRTGAGAHLQPAPAEPHEALGLRPGGSRQEGAVGVCSRGGEREGWGVFFWKGAGSELLGDFLLG